MSVPARLSEAIETLLDDRNYVLLEVGASAEPSAQVKMSASLASREDLTFLSIIHSKCDSEEFLENEALILKVIGELWVAGGAVSWRDFRSSRPGRRIDLPTYPFERKRHWLEMDQNLSRYGAETPSTLVLDRATSSVSLALETLETHILKVWQEVLGINVIGLQDDFFELGGNSLVAITLAERLSTILGCDVALTDLLEARTISKLAARVRSVQSTHIHNVATTARLSQHERHTPFPLTEVQHAYWIGRSSQLPLR